MAWNPSCICVASKACLNLTLQTLASFRGVCVTMRAFGRFLCCGSDRHVCKRATALCLKDPGHIGKQLHNGRLSNFRHTHSLASVPAGFLCCLNGSVWRAEWNLSLTSTCLHDAFVSLRASLSLCISPSLCRSTGWTSVARLKLPFSRALLPDWTTTSRNWW